MLELATLVSHHAKYRPQATAVVFEDERLTWSEFARRVARCANALRGLGVGKGDTVATLLSNCHELLEAFWAAPSIGAVLVPLSPLLMPPSSCAKVPRCPSRRSRLDQRKGERAVPARERGRDSSRISAQRGRQDPQARTAPALLGGPRGEDLTTPQRRHGRIEAARS